MTAEGGPRKSKQCGMMGQGQGQAGEEAGGAGRTDSWRLWGHVSNLVFIPSQGGCMRSFKQESHMVRVALGAGN